MPNSESIAIKSRELRSTDIFVGLLIVLLALLTLAGIYQQTVIQEQRGTIRLLHETTQPRPCTHGGNGYNAG